MKIIFFNLIIIDHNGMDEEEPFCLLKFRVLILEHHFASFSKRIESKMESLCLHFISYNYQKNCSVLVQTHFLSNKGTTPVSVHFFQRRQRHGTHHINFASVGKISVQRSGLYETLTMVMR